MAEKNKFNPEEIANWKQSKELMEKANPGGAIALEAFRDQLMICLVKRCAVDGRLVLPASEVDDTGQVMLMLEIDPQGKSFTFVLNKKQ